MRLHFFSLLAILGMLVSCDNAQKQEVSENNSETTEATTDQIPGHYGAEINVTDLVAADDIRSILEEKDSAHVSFKSTIVANCQASGCWMDLDLGDGEVLKVTFKDYEFFIPLDSEGKTATVEGWVQREIIPVDLLKHYAEDEGKPQEEIDAITEEEIAYTFVADGVVIEE